MMENDALKEKVNQLERRIESLEQKRTAENKEIYERLRSIEIANGVTDERYKSILKELNDQKSQLATISNQLNALNEKPAKRLETAITSTISALVGGVIGYVISFIFGGN